MLIEPASEVVVGQRRSGQLAIIAERAARLAAASTEDRALARETYEASSLAGAHSEHYQAQRHRSTA